MKRAFIKTGASLLPAIVAVCGAGLAAHAQAAQAQGAQAQAGQAAPAPPQPGQVPPRDPRLQAPNVQETTIPPAITTPAPPNGTPDVPNRPLSADEAAHIALRLQPNIAIANANLRLQKGRTTEVRAALNPQATVAAGFTYVAPLYAPSRLPGATASTGFVGSGTLHQLLFDFNHTRDLVSQSVQLEKAANAGITVAQQTTVLQVKQAFYQYVEALRLIQVEQDEVANRQNQLNLATARYNTGLGLVSDVVTAQTAKAEAITNLTLANSQAEQVRVNLAIQMGIDPRTPITPSETGEAVPASTDVNTLTDRALQKRPEALQAQATLRSALYGVRAAHTTNAPIVTGSVGISSAGDQLFPQRNDILVGIAINWTPLDGGLTRGATEAAKAGVDVAAAQLTIAQQTIKADVNNARTLLISAEQRLVTTRADVANAEEGVRVATGRYSTGIGQFVDILNAQAFLLTARINQVTAEEDLQIARADLQHAIGGP